MGDISEVSILSAHAINHKSGGNDSIRIDELAAPLDNTTLNVSISAHGLAKKLDNVATHFLNGQGNYVALATSALPLHASLHVAGGGDSIKLDDLAAPDDNTDLDSSAARHGLLPKLSTSTSEFLRGDGAWADPENQVSSTSVYDSFSSIYTFSGTDAGTGSAYTNLPSPNGLWRYIYRGHNDTAPFEGGTAGVRVPSVLPPDGSPRVFWMKPYTNNNTLSDAALVLSESVFTDFDVTFYMRTVNQLKTIPNEWETCWFMWRFNQNGFNISQRGAHFHHYYVMLKTSGHIEIGRKDQLQDANGDPTSVDPDFQYFLGSASGSYATEPTFTYVEGQWYKIRIVTHGFEIQVFVNDVLKASFEDDGSWGSPATETDPNDDGPPPHPPLPPMANGKFGLYSEDAEIEFSPMTITTGSQTSNTVDPNLANIFTAQQTFSTTTQEPLVLYRGLNTVNAQVGMSFDLNNSADGKVSYAFIEGQIYVNTGGAQSGGLNFYSVLAGASKRVLRLSQSGMVTVNKIAESAVAEVLLTMGVDDDITSSFTIGNAFATTGVFVPILNFSATGASITSSMAAGYQFHEITAANDSGSVPTAIYNTYQNTPAAITTRPLYDWRNNNVSVHRINANGDVFHNIIAQSAVAEILDRWGVADDAGSALTIENAFATASVFIPLIHAAALGASISATHAASYWFNEIKAANDTGSVPVVIYNAYLDTPAAIATRPIFEWRNNNVMVFRIKAGGVEIQDAKDITISSGTGSKIGQSNSKIGFFGTTPVVQQAANADTSGATLPQLETEVNELKAMLRAYGLIQ